MEQEKFYYDNRIVKYFAFATLFWAIIGMVVGLLAALQLVFPVAVLRPCLHYIWPYQANPYERSDLRLRRKRDFHRGILLLAAPL